MPYMLSLLNQVCMDCNEPVTYQGAPYGQWHCACYPDGISDLNLMVGMWCVPRGWRTTRKEAML